MQRQERTNVLSTGTAEAGLQILFRCVDESPKKVSYLVEPMAIPTVPFKDLERVLKNYLQPGQQQAFVREKWLVENHHKNLLNV